MCVYFLYLMHLFDICLTNERQRIYFARAKQIPHVCFPFTLHPYVQHIIKKCEWNCVEFVLFGFCFGHSTSVVCSTEKHWSYTVNTKSDIALDFCAQDTKKKNKWSRWKTWMCVCVSLHVGVVQRKHDKAGSHQEPLGRSGMDRSLEWWVWFLYFVLCN